MKEVNIKVKSIDKIVGLDEIDCKCFVGNTGLNNGYGCIIGDKEDAFKCFHWNCPFACTASLATIKKYDINSFSRVAEEFGLNPEAIKLSEEELEEYDTSFYTEDYMHQFYEVVEIEMDADELEEFKEMFEDVHDGNIEKLYDRYKFNIVEID